MQEQLEKRLKALMTEYEAGQKALANLDAQKASLRETLLRISGAIQVLEEELSLAQRQQNHKVDETPIAKLEPMSNL